MSDEFAVGSRMEFFRPVRQADLVSRPHGLLFVWVKTQPIPEAVWKGARPMIVIGANTFRIVFKRYADDGIVRKPITVVDVEAPRRILFDAVLKHRWIDVVFVDNRVSSEDLRDEDMLNVFASVVRG